MIKVLIILLSFLPLSDVVLEMVTSCKCGASTKPLRIRGLIASSCNTRSMRKTQNFTPAIKRNGANSGTADAGSWRKVYDLWFYANFGFLLSPAFNWLPLRQGILSIPRKYAQIDWYLFSNVFSRKGVLFLSPQLIWDFLTVYKKMSPFWLFSQYQSRHVQFR